jgi:uncharacterized protein YihD (DUF1040 family)
MSRSPERIPIILNKIQKIWEKNSDLRLGQLIINSYACSIDQLYNVEDEVLLENLKELEKFLDNSNKKD